MNNGIDHNLSIDKNNKFFNHFNFCNCIWCQVYGLPVLNEIKLNEGKRYWFEVPKNASTSIKNSGIEIFRACKKDSYHPGKLYDEIDSDVVPLVVYNDPVKRFISLCNDYFSEGYCNFHSNFGKKLFLEWEPRSVTHPPHSKILQHLDRSTAYKGCCSAWWICSQCPASVQR